MLFFTLISAGFVALKLFNSYVIPDIAGGFMLLMGISNAFTYPTRDQGSGPGDGPVAGGSCNRQLEAVSV
jgi:hypothetical protein